MSIKLEVCVEDVAGLVAAVDGGADRVELCSALSLGGLTPSAGLLAVAATFDIPCVAIIRPRAGDFVYTDDEIDIMQRDIEIARDAGVSGVALGANLPDGKLDLFVLETLIKSAEGLDLTLHRAFDLVPDIASAVETAIRLGFSRILTSGGAIKAQEGLDGLRQAVGTAKDRISIMPGSGISAENADAFRALGVTEVHASCSSPRPASDGRVAELGFASKAEKITDITKVRALRQALDR